MKPVTAQEDASRYRAPALDKGLDILELLARESRPLTRAEIVRAMDRSASEVYRMLERLVARQYVARTVGGDRYWLSLKLFALAHMHPPLSRLVRQAQPHIELFCAAARQSCHMGVYDRGNVLIIAQADGPGPLGLSVRLGSQIPLLGSASGHVLLAFCNADERERRLAEHTQLDDEVQVASRTLDEELTRIRQQGFLCRDSRQTTGVTDISFPILGPDQTAFAVLTCPFIQLLHRTDAPSLETSTQQLARTAEQLSLSFAPDPSDELS